MARDCPTDRLVPSSAARATGPRPRPPVRFGDATDTTAVPGQNTATPLAAPTARTFPSLEGLRRRPPPPAVPRLLPISPLLRHKGAHPSIAFAAYSAVQY